MSRKRVAGFLLTWALLATSAGAQVTPLPRAHAHNDYEHERPLVDALDRGFCSIEADVHLVDGELLVAHDRHEVRPSCTLEALYLDPLRERIRLNGGRVYPEGPTVVLLLDVKSDAETIYAVLRRVLRRYADILSVFTQDMVDEGPVTAIISGNRPRALMKKDAIRYAAYDGRLADLYASPPPPATFIPLVSSDWAKISHWRGQGNLPEEARQRLRQVVTKAHAQNRKIRFWATPDIPAVWRELHDAGVDLINTDDLDGLQAFLLEEGGN
jgi:hypothetical protein